MARIPFIKEPLDEQEFKVGDLVEYYCDHEEGNDRVRGWCQGVVVQADTKMIAIQFKDKVYLTDGWMVPDYVLWCPRNSTSIRSYKPGNRKKPPVKKP